MTSLIDQVAEFHRAAHVHMPDRPEHPCATVTYLRDELIREEVQECREQVMSVQSFLGGRRQVYLECGDGCCTPARREAEHRWTRSATEVVRT